VRVREQEGERVSLRVRVHTSEQITPTKLHGHLADHRVSLC
jgi:hypothetical protein